MSAGERFPCPCRCACTATAATAGARCWACSRELHRASPAAWDHFAEGLEVWSRAVGVTRGSSGFSAKQLRRAMEAWRAWHAASRCPLERTT